MKIKDELKKKYPWSLHFVIICYPSKNISLTIKKCSTSKLQMLTRERDIKTHPFFGWKCSVLFHSPTEEC